jgi:hypothetical protein
VLLALRGPQVLRGLLVQHRSSALLGWRGWLLVLPRVSQGLRALLQFGLTFWFSFSFTS